MKPRRSPSGSSARYIARRGLVSPLFSCAAPMGIQPSPFASTATVPRPPELQRVRQIASAIRASAVGCIRRCASLHAHHDRRVLFDLTNFAELSSSVNPDISVVFMLVRPMYPALNRGKKKREGAGKNAPTLRKKRRSKRRASRRSCSFGFGICAGKRRCAPPQLNGTQTRQPRKEGRQKNRMRNVVSTVRNRGSQNCGTKASKERVRRDPWTRCTKRPGVMKKRK